MLSKKYYPGPAAFFSAGPENYIFYNFSTKHSALISRKNAHKYSQLSGIKADGIHLKDLIKIKDPLWGIELYEQLLSLLKKEKLLLPLPDFKGEDKQKKIIKSEIALITCDRPELLSRSLESIAEGIKQNNPDIPVTVFDDSVKNESKIKNKQLAVDIENKYGIKTSCFGKKEKVFFIETLLSEVQKGGVTKELLDFALFGDQKFSGMKGPGGNRNTALLKLSGEKIISFDDDVKYMFVTPPAPENEIEMSYINEPENNIFPDLKKTTGNFKYSETDAVSYIKQVLGKPVINLICKTENSNGSIISDQFRPEPGFLLEKRESTVTASVLGIYGGRWYSSPFGTYFYEGPRRKKIFKNKSKYKRIKENPYHLMLPRCLTMSRAPFFIATAMGIDASELIPPFPPYGRNEDGIWAAIMLALNRKSFISHLPLAIYHETINKKPFAEKDFEDTSASFGIITVLIIESIKRNLLSLFPEITYEILGKQFISISQLADNIFLSFCHDLWLEYTGNLIAQLEKRIIKYKGKPKHWKKDTEEYFILLEKQSLNPLNSLPKELREDYSTEKTIELFKIFFRDYGELLIKWPDICKEAYKLNTGKEKLI